MEYNRLGLSRSIIQQGLLKATWDGCHLESHRRYDHVAIAEAMDNPRRECSVECIVWLLQESGAMNFFIDLTQLLV